MANFKLTNKAVEDLSKIWDYTFEVWSEREADLYYESLIFNCQEIANNPLLGKKYDGITQDLLGMKSNRHIIFYRNLNDNYIEITRILHERMDLKKRLTE
ncbi:type II toxin-antitoxin system RelE/ParE family toxin [Arenibacter sp. 6A1]|uniref:type II toxin-antitoxin system RelE/ParE family toxin n=1 Tax=Arenibacter sp. 6A1 TaxID=2720391 RepID=UPI001445268C|nr:type II toxin-antitoxin system RelE/ParE family toxin [Arenibacter sp. 6A1]NKI25202.1 type II toxin-antitoxin system RelE/ParE family toxin [Arenibacter sp. 6A1]